MDTPFVVGLLVGFGLSLAANLLTSWWLAFRAADANRQLFAGVVGRYVAYALGDSEEINYDKPSGNCQISYQTANVLNLRYEEIEHANVWEAEIWMVSPFSGSMVWRYVRLVGTTPTEPTPIHRFGFKRCAILDKQDRDGVMRKYFYLIGEAPFKKEALEKATQS